MPPSAQSRQILLVALAILAVAAFLPSRWLGFWELPRNIVQFVQVPIAHPISALGRLLRRDRQMVDVSEPLRLANEEKERAQLRNLQLQGEVERLQRILATMGVVQTVDTRLDVPTVVASVYGTAGDLAAGPMRINAGSSQGIKAGDAAVTHGLQLVGRVVEVGPKTAAILPITATGKRAGVLLAAVVLESEQGGVPELLGCTLRPDGEGRLRGPLTDRVRPGTNERVLPVPGQLVRLVDDKWPISAQRLIVGRVLAVEDNPNFPARKDVIVTPTVPQVHLLSEVLVRVEPPPPGGAGGKP